MSATGSLGESSAAAFARAHERGAAYVESRRRRDGLWHDFHTLAGASSQWVTGFVAYALAQAEPGGEGADAALAALAERQRGGGGWGYNDRVPADCDSTAWSLLALTTLPQPRPSSVRRAAGYLRRHQHPAGGFSTYAAFAAIDRCIRAPDQATVDGWRAPHVCVTAVAVQALLAAGARPGDAALRSALEYLRARRRRDGLWQAYWWQGYGYGTYHALKALAWGGALDEVTLRAAQRAIGGRQGADGDAGNPFETAFAVLTLLLDADGASAALAERGACRLLAQQDADGSWPSAPILRIPPPMVSDPESERDERDGWEGTGIVVADQERLFTSAAALWALGVYRQRAGLSSAVMHAVRKC